MIIKEEVYFRCDKVFVVPSYFTDRCIWNTYHMVFLAELQA